MLRLTKPYAVRHASEYSDPKIVWTPVSKPIWSARDPKILGPGLCPLKGWAFSAASSYTRLPKFLAPSSPKPRPLNFRKILVIAFLNQLQNFRKI